ncbi:sigma factor [Sphingobacterium faecium]|uniref:sigma factor n=1 Tax=Sphingobacterium faecium TaxID=34087 RepID=UPI0032087FCA
MGYVNDHDAAKDLSQETFVVVFQQLPKFRQEASVGTWIYRIDTNICIFPYNVGLDTAKISVVQIINHIPRFL